jgi:hypothetical protein
MRFVLPRVAVRIILCAPIGLDATLLRPQPPIQTGNEMIIYIAAVAGACTFVVLWATGLNADVGGLIALGMLFLGVLGQMVAGMLSGEKEEA